MMCSSQMPPQRVMREPMRGFHLCEVHAAGGLDALPGVVGVGEVVDDGPAISATVLEDFEAGIVGGWDMEALPGDNIMSR